MSDTERRENEASHQVLGEGRSNFCGHYADDQRRPDRRTALKGREGGITAMQVELMRTIYTDFSATLLSIAGHDLRQPLQIITSAHDVLGALLREQKQREELARAEFATKKLAAMLGQLVDAVSVGESQKTPCRPGSARSHFR